MNELAHYTQLITVACPNLTIQTVRPHNTDGQYNNLLIINGEFIFRFPRYSQEAQRLKNEVQFLKRVQGHLPLLIPNPIYTLFDSSDPSQTFMGYRMLPGKPIWRETLAVLDLASLQHMAEQMADFLLALHTMPIETHDLDLPIYDRLAAWDTMYAEFREHLYPLMRPDARPSISHHFENYLNNPYLHRFTPSFRHGDFGTGNILFDPETKALCGVIDFGFAGIGDPAIDVAAISTLEKRLFAHFQRVYPNIEPLLDRAAFYKGTYALQEALHGIKNNDPEAFESGIANYR